MEGLARVALTPLFALVALALPASASAWTVTVKVHGAGAVQDVPNDAGDDKDQLNCSVAAGGRSESSLTNCVGGTANGLYNSGNIVRLRASVPTEAYDRGWRFSHYVDGTASGQINCDPQGTTGVHTSIDCTFQIFQNLYVDLYFDDVAGPAASVTGGPTGTVSQTSASFGFDAAGDPDATFECRLDRPGIDGTFSVCGGPADKAQAYTGLTANGGYTFSVRARDPSGNAGATVSRSWTVDTVAPALSLTGAPAAEGGVSTDSTPAFSFTGEAGAALTCSLDSGAYTACSSPRQLPALADGGHTFRVRAADAAGNATTVTRTWTIDTTPPAVTLVSAPAQGGASGDSSPQVTFTTGEPGSAYECAVDGGGFAPCTSPVELGPLADGLHTLELRATDLVGNGPGPVTTRTWTVDTAPPATTLAGGPAEGSTAASGSATFAFSSSEPGATFECRLDGEQFAPCTSPHTRVGIANGDRTFEVRAMDAAGNADPSPAARTWRVNSLDDDADGFNRPQDCDDANPAVHPGALDVADDGADQDCDGADAVDPDRDADGIPRPADCDDADPAIRPGAADLPEDGVDQDCAGGDAVWQMPGSSLAYRFGAAGRRVKVVRLEVARVPAGGTVAVRCRGGRERGCRFKARPVRVADGVANARGAVRRLRLRAGAVLEVRVTAPGMATKVSRFTVRRLPKGPKLTSGCLKPGAASLATCA